MRNSGIFDKRLKKSEVISHDTEIKNKYIKKNARVRTD